MGKERDRKREAKCKNFEYGDTMNMNPILPLTKFDQIGVAVRDVDQAVAFMNHSFGIEFLTMEMPRAKAFLRGKKVEFIPPDRYCQGGNDRPGTYTDPGR